MVIVGINGDSAHAPKRGSHDSGACLLADGKLLAAANEERFSRIKQDMHYPLRTLEWLARRPEYSQAEIGALSWLSQRHQKPMLDQLHRHLYEESAANAELRAFYWKQQHGRWSRLLRVRRRVLPAAIGGARRVVYEHHHAHAASAYYCSPFGNERVLVVTMDGQGDFASASVWIGEQGQLRRVEMLDALNSLGHLYAAFTGHLGFVPNRHEGKIVGLAAHGDPAKLCSRLLAQTRLGNWHRLFESDLLWLGLRPNSAEAKKVFTKLCADLSKEDIAAGIQSFSEHVACAWISELVAKHGTGLIAAAGGVFANVKLNQRIFELPGVQNLYIHPNMGDGGLGVGAAYAALAEARGRLTPQLLESVCLGPDISNTEAREALDNAKLTYEQPADLADKVADLLTAGKVVARAAGGMEYGPRALGNRTLFAACADPAINKWLNDRLQRTEFMPFAPIIMEEYAQAYFPAWRSEHVTARFMTVTYDASELAKQMIPAAIHVDGTARPQVLRQQDNPDVYAILKAFHARTGVPALINTSFNMHEEPIVCSAYDAVRAFLLGRVDALIVGGYLTLGGE